MGKGSDSQHEDKIKYIWALYDIRTLLMNVFPSFCWKPFANRTINSRDIKKSCNPISFYLRIPCFDPPAILAIIENTCYDAINSQCFLIAFCVRGSQENDKVIADRLFFLVGPVSLSQHSLSSLLDLFPRAKQAQRVTGGRENQTYL